MDDQKEQDRIRRRAYEMWEREGGPDGRAEEFWEKAIASIEAEDSPGGANGQTGNLDAEAPRDDAKREIAEQGGASGS
ncbi:DUF2934 domain-containing protein [Caballeronia sp. J97]|uniref:DUF2934 domain-containing protein n=1 Tax=Caballeronia sp. J97 TaxID=2805429 RepID=UPI002AAFB087|nr:DUF2934 domain-containing protein [Caballeronia sp. J97]